MNADEKAVAELFKCDCDYDEASATCFDSGHDLGCKSRHSYVGTALAARIRADASWEVERLRALLRKSQRYLVDVTAAHVTHPLTISQVNQLDDDIDAALKGDA